MKKILCSLLLLISCNGFSQNNSDFQYKKLDGWFTAQQIAPKTWMISDHQIDNIYLLEGKDSALLIDAGFGLADLKSFVRNLTIKPLILVNTHGHPDHTGGDCQFEKAFVGPNEAELAKYYSNPSFLKHIVDSIFHITIPDSLRLKDTCTKLASYYPVFDGQIFNLGGREVQVISTPGHTPGSICLLDPQTKFLFTGDNVKGGDLWLFLQESLPVEVYLAGLQKIKALSSKYTRIYAGHDDKYYTAETLDDLLGCSKLIIDGKGEIKPYQSFMGEFKSCGYKTAKIAFDPKKIKK